MKGNGGAGALLGSWWSTRQGDIKTQKKRHCTGEAAVGVQRKMKKRHRNLTCQLRPKKVRWREKGHWLGLVSLQVFLIKKKPGPP